MDKQLKIISYGGGVQSTAMIVLAVQKKIDFDLALFSNVGDDSETPGTLEYIRDVMRPYCEQYSFPIYEIRKTGRDKVESLTLLQKHKEDVQRNGSTPLPVKMIGNGSGGIANRTCTVHWKAKPITKHIKSLLGKKPEQPALLAIGISTDEYHRANNKNDNLWETRTFPLLELNLSRLDCENIIKEAGLPIPPKSACWFCPFNSEATWAEIRRDDPERFEATARLEDEMNEARAKNGKYPFYWTNKPFPMRDIVGTQGQTLFDDYDGHQECDEGHCWT